MRTVIGLVLFFAACAGAQTTRPDVLVADFEGSDYGAWKAEGDAFGKGPAHGTLPNQQVVSGFEGKGFVNSYLDGDRTTGTLTSPPFRMERKFINMLIGGGHKPDETCVNLLVDGKVVRSSTGGDNELLEACTWDVGAFAGREAIIQVVDKATGGWGHINVDQIVQSDTRAVAPVVADRLYDETYRPQFHFTAKKNWLNDPNGLVFYQGEYHLFFQHNPDGINWGNMTWGHAVSKDLFHWEQLEHAIHPDKLGTIFSGSAVVDWDNTAGFQKGDQKTIVCIYTSAGNPFTQSIAYSTDRGRTWQKYDNNPVIKHISGGNRDPKVVWHAPTKKWVMALFLDDPKDNNLYALFSSPDMKNWERLQDVKLPGASECPDFFPIPLDGDRAKIKWVFTGANGRYFVGNFDGAKYTPEAGPFTADYGANYYAVQTYSDIPESDGRRIQIAWMNGGQYPKMPFNQQMSAPCELTLRTLPEGPRLCRWPAREIESLRAKSHHFADLAVKPGENPLKGLSGDLLDVVAEIEPGQAATLGFRLRGETVAYSAKDRHLAFLGRNGPLQPIDGRIRLRILLDRASIEAFGNDGRLSMTSCFVPRAEKGVEFFAEGGEARIVSMDVHELRSAWPAQPGQQ